MFGRIGWLATVIAALSLSSGRIAAAAPSPKIVFVGNHAQSSVDLVAAIDWPFDASGALLQETFERDLLLLSSYYWDHGYANVKLGVPVVTPELVTIPIEEGPKFTIGDVTMKGASGTVLDPAVKVASLRAQSGDVFSRTDIANDRADLQRHYENDGYAYASVLPFTHVDLAKRTIGLAWEVDRGKRAFFESIDIVAPAAMVQAIRRALPMSAGDQFSRADLDATERVVEAITGGDVVVSTKRGSTDELVKVVVEVPGRQ